MVGKRINGLFLGNDAWTLVVRDATGRHYRFDTANDCCNSVWFNHINGLDILGEGNSFDILRGAVVLEVEDKGWGENRDGEEGYDVVQDGFWTLRTDRGYIDIEVRNSHNGYYGGNVSYNKEVDLSDVEDLRPITEDF